MAQNPKEIKSKLVTLSNGIVARLLFAGNKFCGMIKESPKLENTKRHCKEVVAKIAGFPRSIARAVSGDKNNTSSGNPTMGK